MDNCPESYRAADSARGKPGAAPDVRQLILDESSHLLVAHGYDSLSMRKIAKRIGYSATTIYLYFENKESLFHALIEEGLDRMYSFLRQSVSTESVATGKLRRLCKSYVEFALANPEYYEVMFIMKPMLKHRFPQDKFRRARRNLELFSDTIREIESIAGQTADSIAMAATQVWASLHGAVSLIVARRIDSRINESQLIESMIDAIVSSVDQLGFSNRKLTGA
jgi:AcrR family transcriptional regulator